MLETADGEAVFTGTGDEALGGWNGADGGTGVDVGGVAACAGVIVGCCGGTLVEMAFDVATGGMVGVEDG